VTGMWHNFVIKFRFHSMQ